MKTPEWKHLPPVKLYPIQVVGHRLMQKIKGQWVCVMFGHETVIKNMVEGLNKSTVNQQTRVGPQLVKVVLLDKSSFKDK